MKQRNVLVTIAAAALVLAAGCGGDDDAEDATAATGDAPTTTEPPETTAAPTTTTAAPETTEPSETTEPPDTTEVPTTTASPPDDLPETPAIATIEQAYAFDGSVPDTEQLPVQPGQVTARWYRAGAVYAVVYDGLPPDAQACPGNSGQTTAGFDFVSNAALPGMSCEGFDTFIESTDEQGVQVCGDRVSYLTLIPSDFVAVLYSSIEAPNDAVGGYGVTGAVLVEDPSTLPEVDPLSLSC